MTAAARADAKTVALDGFGRRWMLLGRFAVRMMPAGQVAQQRDSSAWRRSPGGAGNSRTRLPAAGPPPLSPREREVARLGLAPDMMQMTDYDADEFYLRP